LRRNFGSEVYTKSCMRNFISALYSNNIIWISNSTLSNFS
jgi:hypothetical protein